MIKARYDIDPSIYVFCVKGWLQGYNEGPPAFIVAVESRYRDWKRTRIYASRRSIVRGRGMGEGEGGDGGGKGKRGGR